MKKPLAKVNDWTIACGKRDTMLAKMSSDMPLPIPRCVMSSPIHMMNAVPAISVTTMTTFVNHAGGVPGPVGSDGDGQNDPRDVARLFAKLGQPGNEPALVCGTRANRIAKQSRRFASRYANWLRNKLLKDDCPDTACGLKLYWRDAFLQLPFFTTMHRFLPALFLTYGHKVAYELVNDRPRIAGKSKYTNLERALIGFYDLIGVTWLRKRTVFSPIEEDLPSAAIASGSGPEHVS